MSGCCTLWSFSPDRAPLVVRLALDPPPLKPVIAAADNTVSFSLLAVVNTCPRGEAQSLVVVRVAAAGEVVGVLGGRGDEAEGAAPEPVEVHRAGMHSYSYGKFGPCWPRLLATGYSVRKARAGSPVSTTKLTVLGTDVVASALVIVAWAAFVFELVEVPSIVSAFEPVFKLAFARNFSFASCSIAISFS